MELVEQLTTGSYEDNFDYSAYMCSRFSKRRVEILLLILIYIPESVWEFRQMKYDISNFKKQFNMMSFLIIHELINYYFIIYRWLLIRMSGIILSQFARWVNLWKWLVYSI